MKEGVDRESIKLRQDILKVLKTSTRKDFMDFVFTRGSNEHVELKIAAILRLIILLYEENFNRDRALARREFDDLKTETDSDLKTEEEVIVVWVDRLAGHNGKQPKSLIDQPVNFRDLIIFLENAILSEFNYIPNQIQVQREIELKKLRGEIDNVDNDVYYPHTITSNLLVSCTKYLLLTKLAKAQDIFGAISKQL